MIEKLDENWINPGFDMPEVYQRELRARLMKICPEVKFIFGDVLERDTVMIKKACFVPYKDARISGLSADEVVKRAINELVRGMAQEISSKLDTTSVCCIDTQIWCDKSNPITPRIEAYAELYQK